MAKFRTHQRLVDRVMRAVAAGETAVRDVLAAVTPGGGKSLLPVISAARLLAAGAADRICWIVPRDTLRLQAEEAFADPLWRQALGHSLSVRAAENGRDLCRGCHGYVTTYQSVAAAPDLHLAEFRRHRYLLAVDELHHLPAVTDFDAAALSSEETAWSSAIAPLLESAQVRLLMSGTLERADGRPILWLPYTGPKRSGAQRGVRRIDFDAEGWAVVGYSRRQALAEKAVIPVRFGAMDGEAEWRPKGQKDTVGPQPISGDPETARYALYTALRTEFAEALLREAFDACRARRAARRQALGLGPEAEARGLGKLLVVASDQAVARHYVEVLRRWVPRAVADRTVRLAISDMADAHESIASFRLRPEPSVLVTVAMAYEGLDCPEVSHVACLTHIRSRPWLEQMIARATRVDPHGGPYESQAAVVYHPDDLLFRNFRRSIETEQGTRAKLPRGRQIELPLTPSREGGDWGLGIEPLRSNATALRYHTVAPGPDFEQAEGEPHAAAGFAAAMRRTLFETPSEREKRLRQRIGQMVAAQVIEDEDNNLAADGPVGYHAYNAVVKRVFGGRSRGEMGIADLEATIGWLERNRIREHLGLLEGDHRYRYSARRGRQAGAGAGAKARKADSAAAKRRWL